MSENKLKCRHNNYRDNDLPALITPSGCKEWYRNGQLHRDHDKPACETATGIHHWFINGKYIRSFEIATNYHYVFRF